MLVENALSEAVRFFHMNALCSAVALKADFEMALLLVISSGLYRLLAHKPCCYDDAQSRQILRDLIGAPTTVTLHDDRGLVRFHRLAQLRP